MKTIIKIVIALLLVTALFNGARAAFNDYTFTDAVHAALLFDPKASDAEIVNTVMNLAAEHEIPMEASDITVRSAGFDLIVDMRYTTTINLIPGIVARDWTFTPSTSIRLFTKRQ